jgi:multimeric flavodoxin WrbA
MKVAILNGNSDPENRLFEGYLAALASSLRDERCVVETLVLRDMDLRRCTGCFGCWLKTPGVCVSPDDHELLVRAYVHSDVVVFASPLRMGFTSALLKLATEKLLPAVLPYVDTSTGECRHVMRYPTQPRFVVVVQDEPGTTGVDHELVAEMYARFARNANTRLLAYDTISTASKEVSRAIAHA